MALRSQAWLWLFRWVRRGHLVVQLLPSRGYKSREWRRSWGGLCLRVLLFVRFTRLLTHTFLYSTPFWFALGNAVHDLCFHGEVQDTGFSVTIYSGSRTTGIVAP
jgi:hypothetical protein